VVGVDDPVTGQAVAAFVILRKGAGDGGDHVTRELREHVAKEIGKIAQPRQIMVVAELPKTRSGKIMPRLLRDVAENRPVG
ncbi:AMP-binding enzyme, partial [Salmonella enterica]|uniref:AMP-binding enzyme n=1 Tax=Salmonella enterica TaxID=28901 RepID=UPI00391F2E85|nr:acetyl-coenzyme A synthetase [Salmonella enterica subsp. enterica serovar Saphra]